MAIAVKQWDTGQHTNGLLSYILYLSEQARFEINSTIPFTLAPPKMKYLGISTIKYVPNARKMLKLQWMESKNERRKRHSVYRDERWRRESLYSPPLDLSTTCIAAALAPNTQLVRFALSMLSLHTTPAPPQTLPCRSQAVAGYELWWSDCTYKDFVLTEKQWFNSRKQRLNTFLPSFLSMYEISVSSDWILLQCPI